MRSADARSRLRAGWGHELCQMGQADNGRRPGGEAAPEEGQGVLWVVLKARVCERFPRRCYRGSQQPDLQARAVVTRRPQERPQLVTITYSSNFCELGRGGRSLGRVSFDDIDCTRGAQCLSSSDCLHGRLSSGGSTRSPPTSVRGTWRPSARWGETPTYCLVHGASPRVPREGEHGIRTIILTVSLRAERPSVFGVSYGPAARAP